MLPKTLEEKEKMAKVSYAYTIGSLIYAMLCTRSDITYSVSVTNRFHSDPRLKYWATIKNILKYFKRIKDMILLYRGSELRLNGLTYHDFQLDVDDRKSISRFIFT